MLTAHYEGMPVCSASSRWFSLLLHRYFHCTSSNDISERSLSPTWRHIKASGLTSWDGDGQCILLERPPLSKCASLRIAHKIRNLSGKHINTPLINTLIWKSNLPSKCWHFYSRQPVCAHAEMSFGGWIWRQIISYIDFFFWHLRNFPLKDCRTGFPCCCHWK